MSSAAILDPALSSDATSTLISTPISTSTSTSTPTPISTSTPISILDPALSSDATSTPISTPTPISTSPIGFQDVDSRDNVGCNIGKQDIHDEAVEHPVLCKQNGVDPLTGVLLNGSQGTRKTKPSKAIINRTRIAYRRVADPAFFLKYLEETKKRISEGNASSETYKEELTAIATSNFDAQTRTDKVVERVFAAIWSQGQKIFRNVPSPPKGSPSPAFMEVLYSLYATPVDIESSTDRYVECIFREIWRQVQDKEAAGLQSLPAWQPKTTMVSEEEFKAELEAKLKLLDERFEMLDELEKKVDWEAQLKFLERRIEILDMERENDKKKKKKRDKIMRKHVSSLIFQTSLFMAYFEN